MLALCSGSEDAIGPRSACEHTAGSRCAVCGLMFSPTSPAEGAPNLFISAGEAAVLNSSGYLFGRLSTALTALCSLTFGPMCARPHALWLRTARLRWAQTYYETGWGRMHMWWSIFFLCIFYLKYFFQRRGVHWLSNYSCTSLIRALYYMCTHFVLHVQVSFFVFMFLLLCNFFNVGECTA